MYYQIANHGIRFEVKDTIEDQEFLRNYFNKNGVYPPFSQVLIETRNDCNRTCPHCPQSVEKRNLGVMSFEIFSLVIQQLKDCNFAGRLALFMFNEPTLDDRLTEWIRYARSISPNFFIDIHSNGDGLHIKDIELLLLAGLDNLVVNIYNNKSGKISSRIESILNTYQWNPKINIVMRDDNENLSNCAGMLQSSPATKKGSYGFCNFPFRKIAVNWEGNIVLCCNDYRYSVILGNIRRDKLSNTWNTSSLNSIREQLLSGQRSGICSHCDQQQEYNVFT